LALLCLLTLSLPAQEYDRDLDLEAGVLSDHEIELEFKRSREALILERMLPGEKVFRPVATLEPGTRRYTDRELPANEPLQYRLRPRDARSLSQWGQAMSVTIEIPVPPPPRLERLGVDSLRVLADLPPGWTGRAVVERRFGGLYRPVGRMDGAAPQAAFGGLPTGAYHVFRLRLEGQRNSGPPSPPDSLLLDFPPPREVRLTPLSDRVLRLDWRRALPYPVAWEVEKKSPAGEEMFSVPAGDSSWTDDRVPYDAYAYYRVRARWDGNASPFSDPVTFHVKLGPVRDLRLDPVRDRFVHLAWRDSLGLAAAYQVQRAAPGGDFVTRAVLSGRERAWTDTLEARGAAYRYRIASSTSDGLLIYSETVWEEVPRFQEGMVWISGSGEASGFFLDASEVTVAQYLEFCRETRRDPPPDPRFPGQPGYWAYPSAMPAVNVSWQDAVNFCNWRSARLGLRPAYGDSGEVIPGADGFRLPGRTEFDRALTQFGAAGGNFLDSPDGWDYPAPADTTPAAASHLQHLLGNVWEWTSEAGGRSTRVILGGSYSTPRRLAGEVPEFAYLPDWTSPTIGFRCLLPGPGGEAGVIGAAADSVAPPARP